MTNGAAATLAALVGELAGERPPRYAALAARIRLLIGDGRLAVGIRLPAERELATALQLSRTTVTAAYPRLREDGWADARQGAGTWTSLPAGPAYGAWVPALPTAGVFDLAHAAPAAPPEIVTAFAAALADLPRVLPSHGYYPAGLPELRARIAQRYTARGLPTTPEQVLVTAGALDGITVALDVLLGPGDRLLVEHPSYPNALDAVRASGARAVPVAIDAADPAAVARRRRPSRSPDQPPAGLPDAGLPEPHRPAPRRGAAGTARGRPAGQAPSRWSTSPLVELGLDVPPPAPVRRVRPG